MRLATRGLTTGTARARDDRDAKRATPTAREPRGQTTRHAPGHAGRRGRHNVSVFARGSAGPPLPSRLQQLVLAASSASVSGWVEAKSAAMAVFATAAASALAAAHGRHRSTGDGAAPRYRQSQFAGLNRLLLDEVGRERQVQRRAAPGGGVSLLEHCRGAFGSLVLL